MTTLEYNVQKNTHVQVGHGISVRAGRTARQFSSGVAGVLF